MPSNSLLWMIFGNHWLLITDITTTGCPNKLLTDFWGQCWETKFLDHFDKAFGPSSYSNLDLVILGHFGPLYTTLAQQSGLPSWPSNFCYQLFSTLIRVWWNVAKNIHLSTPANWWSRPIVRRYVTIWQFGSRIDKSLLRDSAYALYWREAE